MSTAALTHHSKPSLAVEATWLLAARTLAFLISLVLPIVFARTLAPSVFGVYRLALVLTATATAILPFGFGMSAFYFLPRLTETQRKQLIFNIIAYHTAAAAAVMVLLVVWPGFLTLAFGQDTLESIAPLVGLVVTTSMLGTFLEIVATANGEARFSAIFIVGTQTSRGAILLVAVLLFGTVPALLWAWVLQGVMQSAALLWYLTVRFPKFWNHRDWSLFVTQLRYVAPFGIVALLGIAELQAHNYFVPHFISASQYAVYAIGTAQVPLVGILRDSLSSVMLARMSAMEKDGEFEAMLAVVLKAWRTLALVLFPCFAFLLIGSDDFVVTLYSSRYLDSVPVQRINLILLLTSVFTTDAVLRSFNTVRFWLMRVRIATLVAQVLLLLVLVPRLGMIGGVIALVLGGVADTAVSVYKMFRLLHFRRLDLGRLAPFGKLALLVLGASTLMLSARTLMVTATPFVRLLVSFGVFGSSYLSLLISTRFLTAEEMATGSQLLRRMTAFRPSRRFLQIGASFVSK